MNPTDADAGDIFLALTLICTNGQSTLLPQILEHPLSDPSARQSEALILACVNNHPNIVTLLLEDGRVDPAARDFLPLHYAIRHDQLEILMILVKEFSGGYDLNWEQLLIEALHFQATRVAKYMCHAMDRPPTERVFAAAIATKSPEICGVVFKIAPPAQPITTRLLLQTCTYSSPEILSVLLALPRQKQITLAVLLAAIKTPEFAPVFPQLYYQWRIVPPGNSPRTLAALLHYAAQQTNLQAFETLSNAYKTPPPASVHRIAEFMRGMRQRQMRAIIMPAPPHPRRARSHSEAAIAESLSNVTRILALLAPYQRRQLLITLHYSPLRRQLREELILAYK